MGCGSLWPPARCSQLREQQASAPKGPRAPRKRAAEPFQLGIQPFAEEQRIEPSWQSCHCTATIVDPPELRLKLRECPLAWRLEEAPHSHCTNPTRPQTRDPLLLEAPSSTQQRRDSPTKVNFSPCPALLSPFPTELLCVRLLTACSSSSAHPSGPSRSSRCARITGVGGL